MNLSATVSRRVCVLVLLAMAACGGWVEAAPEPVDPLVGNWLWHQSSPVTISADGTAHNADGSDGTWQYLHNPEVQRHYRIIWEHGKYIDEVACSEDCQRAHIRNQNGVQYNVRRALDDKPAASPMPAPGAASAINPAADPIIGEWRFPRGRTVTFVTDGTVTSSDGGRGAWEFLRNPEAERKYRLTWLPGKYIANLSYNLTAQTGHVVNQEGKEFDVHPTRAGKSADPTPSGNYFGTRTP